MTATMTERAPTTRDLEKQEAALADLRGKAVELREEEERLEKQVAHALADALPAEDAREALREARSLRRDLEAAEGVLEERIERMGAEVRRERARERLQTIQNKVGGLCGEAPRRAEKARELIAELEMQLAWLTEAGTRRTFWQREAKFLAGTFDLPEPDLKTLDVDGPGVAAEARRRLAGIKEPRDTLTIGKHGLDAVAMHARLYGEDSPTPGLVAEDPTPPPRAA